MKRKEFLRFSAMAAAAGPLSTTFSNGREGMDLYSFLRNNEQDLVPVSKTVQQKFNELLEWMDRTRWTTILKDALGVNLSLTGNALQAELVKDLDTTRLKKLMDNPDSGFDDFAGINLIKPGFPAYSLLYHVLASPRVRPTAITEYPGVEQLDALEDYIYSLVEWEHLKTIYQVNSNNDLVLAVFAYEYRPAFKTPHHEHADMVFSRTGVARIGQHDYNFDRINRAFVNQPKDGMPVQHSAVVPARYGLFLAKRVKNSDVNLMTTGIYKPGDKFDDKDDNKRTFLQPIRKVFHGDTLFDESKLTFSESHKSEKLAKLVEHTNTQFYANRKPTIRTSKHLIVQDPNVTNVGSSFLVVSKPEPLIRLAKENGKPVYFLVPAMIPGEDGYSENRYFTSFNTQNVQDVELLVPTAAGYNKIPNQYTEPRTQPLFLNITHEQDTLIANGYREVAKDNATFDKRLNDGNFYAPVFEDSICEGVVSAQITMNSVALNGVSKEVLPGFSIVTAPDFFPQVDNFDLMAFDVAPGTSVNISSFYEGGLATLATCRLTPNPELLPTKDMADTYTAVLSHKSKAGTPAEQTERFKNPSLPKGYKVSGYLPDVASSVFAPGWDITYSADKPGSHDVYLSTEGLGSPFVEDMKLCAAANGMWPASSPDAARTYQGSLDPWSRNSTAIPLLDDEIGFHKNSPAGLIMGKETFGWDGVQGPFLQHINGKWKVNFADVGRSDVVQNALDGNVDLSKLRLLTSAELISRMACLKKCIEQLPKVNFKGYTKEAKMVAFTRWWLISAEPVEFGASDAKGWGIPTSLVGNDTKWVTDRSNAKVSGKGYLFVIVDVNDKTFSWDTFSRRLADVKKLYVFQVVDNGGSPKAAMATVKGGKVKWM